MAHRSPIKILTRTDGGFRDVVLEGSYLIDRVFTGSLQWSVPVVLHGQDVDDDLRLLESKQVRGESFLKIRDLQSTFRKLKWVDRFGDTENLFDLRLYRNLKIKGRSPQKVEDLFDGGDIEVIITTIRDGPRGERKNTSHSRLVTDLLIEVDRICSNNPIIISWPSRFNAFCAFVVAIWLRKPRPYPLVITSPKALNFGSEPWVNVRASVLEFTDLSAEVEATFGVEAAEVEKAYWVWQLSRGERVEKERATTPKTISIQNARDFLAVLVRSRPSELRAGRLEQRAAPVIFEQADGLLGLRRSHLPGDSADVVRAAAESLARQLDRLAADGMLANVLPSSKGVFSVVGHSVRRVISDVYDDGDVITIGIELNAFQYHVESRRADIEDGLLGELIGIFATGTLFLSRFRIWRDYAGVTKSSGKSGDGLAQFHSARALLSDAKPSAVLEAEAAQRVDVILSRAPADNSPPELREGVIRSGENLAAITVNAASRIAAKEAAAFGGEVKKKTYEESASSLVKFAVRNAHHISDLARLQNWRWADWVYDVLKSLGLGG